MYRIFCFINGCMDVKIVALIHVCYILFRSGFNNGSGNFLNLHLLLSFHTLSFSTIHHGIPLALTSCFVSAHFLLGLPHGLLSLTTSFSIFLVSYLLPFFFMCLKQDCVYCTVYWLCIVLHLFSTIFQISGLKKQFIWKKQIFLSVFIFLRKKNILQYLKIHPIFNLITIFNLKLVSAKSVSN